MRLKLRAGGKKKGVVRGGKERSETSSGKRRKENLWVWESWQDWDWRRKVKGSNRFKQRSPKALKGNVMRGQIKKKNSRVECGERHEGPVIVREQNMCLAE